MAATLKGQSVPLRGELVRADRGDETARFEVDHVMGRDFAKKAYDLQADDDNGVTYRIAFYGNSPVTARKDVTERGFTNIRNITEYDSICPVRNL